MKHFISKFPFFGGNFQQLNNQKGIKDDVEKNDMLYTLQKEQLKRDEQVKTDFMKEFKTALEEDRLTVYYQPIVNSTGQIELAEALLRWNDPEKGVIPPNEFIPLVVQSGLIDTMTEWVIIKVCEQLEKWSDSGKSACPISINLSPKTLANPSFVHFVEKQLNNSNIPSNMLEFELTESSLFSSEKVVLTSLNKLKNLGIQIAIDDFGTKNTSFEYLRSIEANKLKIDTMFIKNLDSSNDRDKTIVSSMIYLGKGLGLDIVAEGVEQHDQFHFLKQQECQLMQGYLFSKPIPVDEFEPLLQKGTIFPKAIRNIIPDQENREYFRFEFTNDVQGKMTVIAVNHNHVDLGTADILIKDISLGGLKIQSNLSLPVIPNFCFRFMFTLMNEHFDVEGKIRWKEKGKANTYLYGFQFLLDKKDENRLALIINKMSTLKKQQLEIPGTPFVYEDASYFFAKRNKY